MRKITFKQAFLKKYPKYGRVLSYMNESLGHEFEWKDFSKLNIIDFIDYVSGKVAQSSQKTYCAMIKSVLNMYCEEVDIPCRNYADMLTVRNVKSSNTWLTEEELLRLISYKPESEIERYVRNLFVIGAYTGCRHSDFMKLDKTNVVNGNLVYVSQKTNIQACVPLKPIVLKYLPVLTPSGEKLEHTPSGEKFKTYSDATFNRTIREICRKCGITERIKLFRAGKEEVGEKWEFVSSHTARRSFATNLYLLGLDIFTISKMMGHSSVDMTSRYIVCQIKELPERVMRYFY